MTLLHGSGGLTGKRPRIDRQRAPESDSGPLLRSFMPAPVGMATTPPASPFSGLSVDPGPSLHPGPGASPELSVNVDGRRSSRDGVGRRRPAILEAALARLAEAGPTPADVLEVLVTDAAALLDVPARLAVVTSDRLVWTASCGDPSTPIGLEVDAGGTACGTAWRTGQIQHVTAPPTGTGPGPQLTASAMIELARGVSGPAAEPSPDPSTRCCGTPAELLVVPLLRPGRRVARHADPVREVIAVLALLADRAGWFDDADIEVAADLAEIAGERIAALQAARQSTLPAVEPMTEVAEPAEGADRASGLVPPPVLPPPVLVVSPPVPFVQPSVPVVQPLAPVVQSPVVQPPVQLTLHTVAEPARRTDDPARIDFDGWFAPVIPMPTALPAAVPRLVAALRPRSTPERPFKPEPEPEPEPEPDLELDLALRESGSDVDPERTADLGRISALVPLRETVRETGRETTAREAGREEEIETKPQPIRPARPGRPGRPGVSRLPLPMAWTEPAVTAAGPPLPPAMPAPDSMGLWQWDAVENAVTWSSPVARLLGLAPDARLTLDAVREALVAADRGRFDVAVRAIASGRGVAGAVRLKTPDGRAKHAYAWSEVRRDHAGAVVGAWGGVVDVTAFEHDAATLRRGLAGLRAAQELTGLATWQWRPSSGELIWSDEMYRLVGVDAEEFSPTPERWHAFIHPDDLERARGLDLAAGDQDGERVETFRLIGPGGEIRHVQSWSAPSRVTSGQRGVSDDDRVIYGATIDVTRQVHDRMMLERLSATDPVTGLGNRLAYDRRMKELLAAAPAAGPAGAVTLMLLDLDRFKVVNDSLGHQIGDRLLIEVARRLVAVVPEGSVTARMGGDEFVVVPPVGAGELDVRRLAIGIVDALRAPYVLPETGEMLICPASLGIATSGGRRVSSHDLLREADIALYRAKDSGRDRFVIFDEVLKARTQVRQRAERQLREALAAGRLVMEYQPVIDFNNGRIVGAEGLVRLRDAEVDGRLIAPELFLDIAEQTGLVVELDTWVIENAIRQLAHWSEHYGSLNEPPWLAINLSARSMEHPQVVRRLIDAVKRGEVPRDRIKIELTEHSFIGALPGVEVALRLLMANGIGVGIDDFGTGYSALAYLHHFDLDFMKIDRSFVASVGEGARGDAVVTAIVDLAHAHGMRVIAEGVESGRQARRLREMGCDFAQGFHFGRPGEAARIVRG